MSTSYFKFPSTDSGATHAIGRPKLLWRQVWACQKHLLLAGALSNTQSAVRHQYHYAAACVPGIEHSPHQSSCLVDPMIGKKRYDLSTHFPFEIIRRVACQWCAATCVRTAVVVVVVLLPYVYSLQSWVSITQSVEVTADAFYFEYRCR